MISIVIQAGGLSQRMGQDKGLVKLNGIPLIEHVINRLDGLADETIVTTNSPQTYKYLDLPLASDEKPGAGALAGLLTALTAAKGEYVFVIACDMPFVNRKLVETIISSAAKADVIIPHINERLQPLHALYHRSNCLGPIQQAIVAKQKRMISFHDQVSIFELPAEKIIPIDPKGLSFMNINTPEELAQMEKMFPKASIES